MKPVQEELKQIRLKKGISLAEISRKTKIRLDFLESIEEGDLSVTPMPYIRAFLREYAEIVGVDPHLVILKLDNKIESILTQKPVNKTTPKKDLITPDSSETMKRQSGRAEGTEVTSEDKEILESKTTSDTSEPENDEIQTTLFKELGEKKEHDKQLDDSRKDDLPKDSHAPEEEIPPSEESRIEEPDTIPSQTVVSDDNEETGGKPGLPEKPDTNRVEAVSSDDESKDGIIGEKSDLPDGSENRKLLVIEEAGSLNRIFFIAILSILIIITLIIIFLNRGSLF